MNEFYYLVRKTLSATPRLWYRWKAETLSFLHVLLVWGVKLVSLLNKRRQSWTIHSKQTEDGILERANKETVNSGWVFDDSVEGLTRASDKSKA